jgi:MFS family permease
MASRAARSFSMSLVSVMVPLIVADRHFDPASSGAIFSSASIGAAVLLAVAGALGDRIGRRPVLFGLAALAAVATAGFGLTGSFLLLAAFAFLGALARGGNAGSGGASGPFAPVEQPLVAEVASEAERGHALGQLSFVGVIAGAAGSLAAGLPAVVQGLGGSFFAGVAVTMLIGAMAQILSGVLVLPVRERPLAPQVKSAARRLSPAARGTVLRLSLTNALNGFGAGFLGPFLTYWLASRFGATAAQLSLLFTVANLVTAFSYLRSDWLGRRFGRVPAILWTRLIGSLLTIALAFAPTFLWVGIAYTVRMVFQTVSNPIRQDFVLGLVEPGERSRVNAVSSLPQQVTLALSPLVGGYLLQDLGLIYVPLAVAATFQAANAVLFNMFFGRRAQGEQQGLGA